MNHPLREINISESILKTKKNNEVTKSISPIKIQRGKIQKKELNFPQNLFTLQGSNTSKNNNDFYLRSSIPQKIVSNKPINHSSILNYHSEKLNSKNVINFKKVEAAQQTMKNEPHSPPPTADPKNEFEDANSGLLNKLAIEIFSKYSKKQINEWEVIKIQKTSSHKLPIWEELSKTPMKKKIDEQYKERFAKRPKIFSNTQFPSQLHHYESADKPFSLFPKNYTSIIYKSSHNNLNNLKKDKFISFNKLNGTNIESEKYSELFQSPGIIGLKEYNTVQKPNLNNSITKISNSPIRISIKELINCSTSQVDNDKNSRSFDKNINQNCENLKSDSNIPISNDSKNQKNLYLSLIEKDINSDKSKESPSTKFSSSKKLSNTTIKRVRWLEEKAATVIQDYYRKFIILKKKSC